MPKDIDEYRDEHESDEHWALRKAFIERWRHKYSEDRLLCLARVFINIEFMGCRYPPEVMQEIAMLSQDVAKSYRSAKSNKLQRTFVSASDAAEDRAKGVKRKGGVVEETNPKRINFVAQGHFESETIDVDRTETTKQDYKKSFATSTAASNSVIVIDDDDSVNQSAILDDADVEIVDKRDKIIQEDKVVQEDRIDYNYMEEFNKLNCLDVRNFREDMFHTNFGRIVLMVRPWISKLNNIQASCSGCGLEIKNIYANSCMNLSIGGKIVASATGSSKLEARSIVETIVWNRMRAECIILLIKQQFLAKDSERISSDIVSDNRNKSAMETGFGTPLESSVASKMMKLMGWTGGGLGANEEGISEPIRPHLQQVHRAGLGSGSEITSIHQLKARANDLMRKYRADDSIDVDLVFSADFSKEERAELHQVARRCGLNSKSYGAGNDRFLVVRKKVDPFTITRNVVRMGGSTPKYEVFIPSSLAKYR